MSQQQQQYGQDAELKHILDDSDLAGPLLFCLALGFVLIPVCLNRFFTNKVERKTTFWIYLWSGNYWLFGNLLVAQFDVSYEAIHRDTTYYFSFGIWTVANGVFGIVEYLFTIVAERCC